MKNSIKNLKNYFQLIVTAVTCFVMGFVKDRESACTGSCDERTVKRSGFLGRLWKSLGMCLVYETPKAKMISEYIVKIQILRKTGRICIQKKKGIPEKIKLYTGMNQESRIE